MARNIYTKSLVINYKFKKILTIHSSVALNFKNVEVEFYEDEINNEKITKGREFVKKQYYELKSKK